MERSQESQRGKWLWENGTKGGLEMREAAGLIKRKGEKVSCMLFFFFSFFFPQMILPHSLYERGWNSKAVRNSHQIFTAFCFQPPWKPLKITLSQPSSTSASGPKAHRRSWAGLALLPVTAGTAGGRETGVSAMPWSTQALARAVMG